jgi:thioredoxin-related protein
MLYKNVVLTSQETHYVSTTETNQLLIFRQKKTAVYCEKHTKHTKRTNALRGQNEEF